jgi:hypothetical protein
VIPHPLNIFMGFLAGLLCSLGGALKDSPFEGFQPLRFTRSMFVGTGFGFISQWITDQPIVAFVFAGYFERMAVEGYKIIRAQKPGKFNLPDPAILGRTLGFRQRKEAQ